MYTILPADNCHRHMVNDGLHSLHWYHWIFCCFFLRGRGWTKKLLVAVMCSLNFQQIIAIDMVNDAVDSFHSYHSILNCLIGFSFLLHRANQKQHVHIPPSAFEYQIKHLLSFFTGWALFLHIIFCFHKQPFVTDETIACANLTRNASYFSFCFLYEKRCIAKRGLRVQPTKILVQKI